MLNSKRKEFLYAFSAFGPGLIMTMLMAYFTSSVDARNLGQSYYLWSWAPRGAAIVLTSGLTFGLLFTIGRIFDAAIDIPLANRIDRMKSRYARIRLPVIISFIPMLIGAIGLTFPLFTGGEALIRGSAQQWGNSFWFFGMSILFFAFYSLCIVAFFGSLATVCKDRAQRARIAYFKAFIDTVMFAIAYALAPLIITAMGDTGSVMTLIMYLSPLMLTIFIPVIMTFTKSAKEALKQPLFNASTPQLATAVAGDARTIQREVSLNQEQEVAIINQSGAVMTAPNGANFSTDTIVEVNTNGPKVETLEDIDNKEQKVGVFKSVAFVFKSRAFWPWLVTGFMYMLGLQLFLASQNDLISGVLNLAPAWAAVLNSAAFGPVPIMLLLFNKILKRNGLRFAFQVSLLCFGLGISFFSLGSSLFFPNSIVPRIIINAIGGTISSFGIGILFMMPLMVSSQVSAVEKKVKKRNNSAMYFAGQGIIFGIAGAIAGGVLWQNGLKGVGYLPAQTGIAGGGHYIHYCCQAFLDSWRYHVNAGSYFNMVHCCDVYILGRYFMEGHYSIPLGGFIAPFVVFACALIAIGLSFLMPKSYDAKTIGKLFDKNYSPDIEDLKDVEISVVFKEKYSHIKGYDILRGKWLLSLVLAFIPGVNLFLGVFTRLKRKQIVFGIFNIIAYPIFMIVDI
ncbi:MAG: MFS transporter, partial [Firmicutes bacterium]|nr:MFS transporter [Bacillota bacterium]